MSKLDSLILIGGVVVVGYFLLKSVKLPPQTETSPQRPELLGLRSTNKLGFDIQTAFANLRDNLSIGGLLFQG